jgi:phosphatidylinositol glycan class N
MKANSCSAGQLFSYSWPLKFVAGTKNVIKFLHSAVTFTEALDFFFPHFCSGASGNHVYIDTYGPEVQDFSGRRSTTKLDTWVFRKVERFLNSAKSDTALNEKLHQDRIIFFLHLLGLDTAGHTYKPHSV